MSVFFQLEFLPFPDQFSYEPRQAFKETYNGALIADKDHFVYGMARHLLEVLTAGGDRRRRAVEPRRAVFTSVADGISST